jgi:hypothetical protein
MDDQRRRSHALEPNARAAPLARLDLAIGSQLDCHCRYTRGEPIDYANQYHFVSSCQDKHTDGAPIDPWTWTWTWTTTQPSVQSAEVTHIGEQNEQV